MHSDLKIEKHIAVVILNHNSEKDLQICAEQIARQLGVRLSIILVDNASGSEGLLALKTWLAKWRPGDVCGTESDIQTWARQHLEHARRSGNVYLVENSTNKGYSAGNNTGIRVADMLKADAVLIANPDMRIEEETYLAELSNHLFADPQNYIAASRIVDLAGENQNPLREASFWEELFWPRWLVRSLLKTKSYVVPCRTDQSAFVYKVSGCCMLLRMDFLRSTNYLDENTFLYCEEPILSARVNAAGGKILYVPMVKATHAHIKSEKGDGTKLMPIFIQSRKYYLKTYSGYNRWQLALLFASYDVLAFYNRLKRVGKTLLYRVRKSNA